MMMNGNNDGFTRTPSDFILFAIVFVGFVLGAAGLVTTTVPIGVTGVIAMLLGFCGFMLKSLFE